MPHVRHIFVSHKHPVHAVDSVDCVAGRGIRGDRFFDYKPDYKGQITFFVWETLQMLWAEFELPVAQRDPTATRRNVITEGLDLDGRIGKRFTLQGIKFYGTEDCRPCYWMNGAIHPDAEAWMPGPGGVRAKILSESPWLVWLLCSLLARPRICWV